jgi:hypothetical protein
MNMNTQNKARRRRIGLAPLALAVALSWIGLAPGACRGEAKSADNLQEVVRDAAEEILKVVKDRTVSIGQITPTGLPDTNGGPAIAVLLKQELLRISPGSVQRIAAFEIKGDYDLAPSPDDANTDCGKRAVRLSLRIIDTSGQPSEVRLQRFIRDNTSIIRLTGVSGKLPLDPSKSQVEQGCDRNQKIQVLVKAPETFKEESSRISSSPESPYRVEILAGPLGDGKVRPTKPRPVQIQDDLAFVDVRRDEVYEIRVYNHSPEEVAIRVFIDGLDMFYFSEDRVPSDDRNPQGPSQPKYAYLVVPAAKEGQPGVETIQGWHKSVKGNENFLAFLVTEYGKGAASKEGIPATGPVGMIQVQFSQCHPVLPGGRKRSAGNETIPGPPRKVDQKEVEREVEPPIDVVSIRYTR